MKNLRRNQMVMSTQYYNLSPIFNTKSKYTLIKKIDLNITKLTDIVINTIINK